MRKSTCENAFLQRLCDGYADRNEYGDEGGKTHYTMRMVGTGANPTGGPR